MIDPQTAAFHAYLQALRQTPLAEQTEHTSRAALEALLAAFKPAKAVLTHEPKRAQDKGAPDFKISAAGQILGYGCIRNGSNYIEMLDGRKLRN